MNSDRRPDTRICPQGDSALRVTFSAGDQTQRWTAVRQLVVALESMDVPALLGVAGTYDSALVEFDSTTVSYENMQGIVDLLLRSPAAPVRSGSEERRFRLPVVYGGEHGPDLPYVASLFGVGEDELIALHSSTWYRIRSFGAPAASPLMDGPGTDHSVPRRQDPRVRVAGGSVALAGVQSIVYSVDAPGGWQLIGRTPVELVTTRLPGVCRYRPGDWFSYVAITPDEWDRHVGRDLEDYVE